MATDVFRKSGSLDLELTFEITLTDEDGAAVDLTDAASARMYIKLPDDSEVTVTATVSDPAGGVIQYVHDVADFALSDGLYEYAGAVTWTATSKESVGKTLGSIRVLGIFDTIPTA